jgi:16S rRNA (guanine1207-N2)-methyltransferase
VAGHYFSRRPEASERRGLLRCRLRGLYFEFVTSSGVFSPRALDQGTRLLVESMVLPESGAVLDMGCGYGPVGIVATMLEPLLEVWMTDINERAVALARENARRNGVENVVVVQGHLYEPVGVKAFNAIVSNPPISAGMRKVVEPLINGAADHLIDMGSLQVVVQSNKGGRALSSLMEKAFGNVEVLSRRGGYRVLRAEKV